MIPRIVPTRQSIAELIQNQKSSPSAAIFSMLLPYLILGAFTICLLWPLCIGRTLFWGDILLYFDPMNRFARHELLIGRLPLWNPYILCGQPFIGNPQMSVIYPTTVLLVLFPSWMALNLSTLLHLFLCGTFAFCFLRRWTLHATPALAGAIVYMGSACILGRLQFPPMIQTAAYFPLLFAVLDKNIDRPSQPARAGLAITVALTLFAAHTQVAYLAFTSGIAYGTMRLWRQNLLRRPPSRNCSVKSHYKKDVRGLLIRCVPFISAASLGLLLAAIYLVPALQLLHESPRERMSIGQTNRFFTDVPHLLTLLFPRFAGHPVSRDFWARGNAWEPAWFIGWIPLLFIGYAIVRCSRENLVRFWSIITLLGIWLSLGSNGGLFTVCFYVIPGLANFHDPARFLLWTTLGFAVLTAVGMDAMRLRAGWFTRRTGVFTLGAILLPIWCFNRDWNPTTVPAALQHVPDEVNAIRKESGKGRMALPANSVYWRHAVNDGYMDFGASDRSGIAATTDTLLSNVEMRSGLESASGYEPVPIAGQVALEGLSRVAIQRRDPIAGRLMGLLNVQTILLPSWQKSPNSRFEFVNDAANTKEMPLHLFKNRDALPRAWLTRHVKRIEGRMRLALTLTDPDFDPLECTIVSGDPTGVPELEWGTGEEKRLPVSSVVWHTKSPLNVQLAADAGSAPAFLVYSATAYPGWKAVIDGKSAPLCQANGAFLGLQLPPGKHRIQLIYSPDVFRLGSYLSLIGGGVLSSLATMFLIAANKGKSGKLDVNGTT